MVWFNFNSVIDSHDWSWGNGLSGDVVSGGIFDSTSVTCRTNLSIVLGFSCSFLVAIVSICAAETNLCSYI